MNVLWIVVDCLRPDHMGCYGYRRRTTPHIDRFARDAVIFERMISPHIPTQPAHTTLFTGRDVFSHHVVAQGGNHELSPEIPLLPALLSERGYFTAAVDNIGRWIEPAFQRYEKYPRWNHDGTLPWRNGEEVTERALSILTEAKATGSPWFTFLHYWDPHTPYLPPPPFDRMFYTGDEKAAHHASMDPVWKSPWFANYFREWLDGVRDIDYVKAQYDAGIAYSDACIGRVFQRLTETDAWDDTLVILQADHGEELDDHGCWFDHHGLYDTNVHVPVLMRFPQARMASRRVGTMQCSLDLAATVLDSIGLGELARDMDGRPIDLATEAVAPREAVYLTECTWMRKRGWRTADWKLIEALEPDIYGIGPIELYHLPSDPGEMHNLATERGDVVARLRQDRDRHVAARLSATGGADPLVEQSDALRTWQPRFIAGRAS